MLTEQEIIEKKARIQELEDQEKSIEEKILELKEELNTDSCEKAKAKFPNINEGDKVIVHWTDWQHRPLSETYYFRKVIKSRWNTSGIVRPENVTFVFRKLKKDGSPSLREECFPASLIDKIEKVQ